MNDEELALDSTTEEEQDEVSLEEELSKEEQAKARLKEAVQVQKQEIGPLRLGLTVTLPEDYLAERLNEQFVELKRDAIVPGFRKGHAPMRLVEKRYSSDVGEQLKTQLIGGGYLAAVEKAELKPIGDPLFRVKVKSERTPDGLRPAETETEKLLPIDKALDTITLPKQGALVFSCEVELKPEFELPPLENIPVKRPAREITEDDVTEEIRRLRMGKATFRPVESGVVEKDDLLYARMTLTVDGQVVASDENAEMAARDIRVASVPLVGFADAVIGKNTGESVSFEAVVPDDHDNMEIRGKKALFDFVIQEIKRIDIPPLDAKFLATVGCDNESELRELIRNVLESTLEDLKRQAIHAQIEKYLLDGTTMPLPDALSQRQTDRIVGRRMIEMLRENVPPAELLKELDKLRVVARERVGHDLKLMFILEKIANERDIEINEGEINAAIGRIAKRTNQRFDRVRDDLAKADGLMALAVSLRDEKVLDALLQDADVKEIEGPATEEEAAE